MKKYSSQFFGYKLTSLADSPHMHLSTSEYSALELLKHHFFICLPSLPVVKALEPLFRNARLFKEKNTRQKPSSTL